MFAAGNESSEKGIGKIDLRKASRPRKTFSRLSRIFKDMRNRTTLPACTLLLAMSLLLWCVSMSGCNRGSGGMLGGNSATGDSSQQGSEKKGGNQPKAGGQTDPPITVPRNTVSGQPSTASDDGSPNAVAHRSVAQPGAPQGTTQQGPAKVPRATPAPSQH